ncbi:NAD(P)/FAD-dependent oxidoreductase [Enterovirga rhinocerotis]|uniref:Nitrite reductase (NADH) large subunit n=1 Tax=Enterovirga rhinocerotis TaxID=1339210 RepID=A0A4R7BJX1_9HYPH|nr:FAD-dependent oxidoreductase [Enterovirga rhinocerotis]TDR85501.1 nitrite reductase (NADH) large subunit [Enterovirga rhinocerotis]
MTRRLVVVGNGMVSLRFLERLCLHAPGRYDVTVIGQEAAPAYNRVLLSALLAGDVDETGCNFRERGWYEAEHIRLRTGAAASAIDRAARTVSVAGEAIPYDRLVLATGSTPIMLPKPGMDLPGVMAFRDLADVDRMKALRGTGARCIVIGGGLLGLEAAYGLARLGLETTLLHVMDKLMERQLDRRAAAIVRKTMEAKGVRVVLQADTAEIVGDGRVEALRLADGTVIPADLVVVAVGVRPRVDLAREAGLAIGRGIQVDDGLATSDPSIFAIGECAEHRGMVYGLVEPGYEMADTLAGRLAGKDRLYCGSTIATSLKVSGLPVFSAGEIADDAGGEPILLSDPVGGIYRKLVLKDGRLAGALLIGDTGEGAWYRSLIESRAPVSAIRHDLMFGRVDLPQPEAAPSEPTRMAA